MFQYAFGRSLAQKHQTKLFLEKRLVTKKKLRNGHTFRSFELDIFQLSKTVNEINYINRIIIFFYRITNAISNLFGFSTIQTSNYFIEREFSYNSNISKIGKNCFLSGYWQSHRYFDLHEHLIRDDFRFDTNLDKKNRTRLIKIRKENSVSIHIRRSDFLNNKYHTIHGTCSAEYYNKAIKNITAETSSPIFFIFSDDIQWAQDNLNLDHAHEFISGNEGKQSYIDMQLMSQCKHNIIANSSFSWWGAWLNSNKDKIVIAPKEWFSNETMNSQTNDLIPKTWKRL